MTRWSAAFLVCLLMACTIMALPVPTGALRYGQDWSLANSDASFRGEASNDFAGKFVKLIGDVNGDGFDDILIGAPYNDEGGTDGGQVYLFLGKSSGWAKDTNVSNADASFIAEAHDDLAGYFISGAGDVNGDGYDDFLIGATLNMEGAAAAGQSYLIFGKASGWAMDTNLSTADASFLGEAIDDTSGSVPGHMVILCRNIICRWRICCNGTKPVITG